ncbi:putative bifunctional diguanylate cyclase/phosphodiesterase [Sphingomonas lenta]|uniref:EAL domain-containing protein n=1 Tax=Sphingomonas lenta TaxID=1141887 RepID=A0A2A2SIL5_9SPHN|nr:EAL domain-containing protein [Sphingomonas lenta]PAX09082.1 hypothetical protein CKY28_07085 [Sphingomonas lenta]
MKPFRSPRLRLTALFVAALTASLLFALSGLSGFVERAIDPLRIAAQVRPASGGTVLVEMDAESAATIKRWPWPRDHYARAVDRLREAGAAAIAFDVDFSSTATPDGDRAFADAIARANGTVALPTFRQRARSGEERSLDALPIPILREHAALASVSIAPDADGHIRHAPFGTITDGTPRPSLSAWLAHRSGSADTFFPIDHAIDPGTIPRLSFVAVRDGRFDPRLVRGREVVVGATAVEMGDRYAVPHWGVVPGVVVQALATETLKRGVPVEGGVLPSLLTAVLAGLAMLRVRAPWAVAGGTALATAALFILAIVAQTRWQYILQIAPGLCFLLLVAMGRIAHSLLDRFQEQRLADETTGLPNRRAMLAELNGRARVELAVAHVADLESLLAVLGEAAERDLVLRVAERLRLAAKDARVYRIADRLLGFEPAGDEDAGEMFAGVRAMMLQPVEVGGRRVDVGVAIGLAEGDCADACATQAALAAEQAQAAGVFWRRAAADLAELERRVSLMGELDEALRAGGIEVYYQPKLAIAEGRVASAEALVRWRHPERGFVGPDLFIPLAEQTDRIGPLTLYVLERVMEDLAQLRALGHQLTAAVNISAKLVASAEFNQAAGALLARGVVPPSVLIFEVTESATLEDPDAATEMLRAYRELGVTISMDDYGTGQSTLTYLRELPLSELKIDRSFVQHAHRNRNDGVMVRSTVQLAHELGLKVVAEGVEDEDCLDFLRQLGCDMAQGYLISRPLPAPALIEFMDRNSGEAGGGMLPTSLGGHANSGRERGTIAA